MNPSKYNSKNYIHLPACKFLLNSSEILSNYNVVEECKNSDHSKRKRKKKQVKVNGSNSIIFNSEEQGEIFDNSDSTSHFNPVEQYEEVNTNSSPYLDQEEFYEVVNANSSAYFDQEEFYEEVNTNNPPYFDQEEFYEEVNTNSSPYFDQEELCEEVNSNNSSYPDQEELYEEVNANCSRYFDQQEVKEEVNKNSSPYLDEEELYEEVNTNSSPYFDQEELYEDVNANSSPYFDQEELCEEVNTNNSPYFNQEELYEEVNTNSSPYLDPEELYEEVNTKNSPDFNLKKPSSRENPFKRIRINVKNMKQTSKRKSKNDCSQLKKSKSHILNAFTKIDCLASDQSSSFKASSTNIGLTEITDEQTGVLKDVINNNVTKRKIKMKNKDVKRARLQNENNEILKEFRAENYLGTKYDCQVVLNPCITISRTQEENGINILSDTNKSKDFNNEKTSSVTRSIVQNGQEMEFKVLKLNNKSSESGGIIKNSSKIPSTTNISKLIVTKSLERTPVENVPSIENAKVLKISNNSNPCTTKKPKRSTLMSFKKIESKIFRKVGNRNLKELNSKGNSLKAVENTKDDEIENTLNPTNFNNLRELRIIADVHSSPETKRTHQSLKKQIHKKCSKLRTSEMVKLHPDDENSVQICASEMSDLSKSSHTMKGDLQNIQSPKIILDPCDNIVNNFSNKTDGSRNQKRSPKIISNNGNTEKLLISGSPKFSSSDLQNVSACKVILNPLGENTNKISEKHNIPKTFDTGKRNGQFKEKVAIKDTPLKNVSACKVILNPLDESADKISETHNTPKPIDIGKTNEQFKGKVAIKSTPLKKISTCKVILNPLDESANKISKTHNIPKTIDIEKKNGQFKGEVALKDTPLKNVSACKVILNPLDESAVKILETYNIPKIFHIDKKNENVKDKITISDSSKLSSSDLQNVSTCAVILNPLDESTNKISETYNIPITTDNRKRNGQFKGKLKIKATPLKNVSACKVILNPLDESANKISKTHNIPKIIDSGKRNGQSKRNAKIKGSPLKNVSACKVILNPLGANTNKILETHNIPKIFDIDKKSENVKDKIAISDSSKLGNLQTLSACKVVLNPLDESANSIHQSMPEMFDTSDNIKKSKSKIVARKIKNKNSLQNISPCKVVLSSYTKGNCLNILKKVERKTCDKSFIKKKTSSKGKKCTKREIKTKNKSQKIMYINKTKKCNKKYKKNLKLLAKKAQSRKTKKK